VKISFILRKSSQTAEGDITSRGRGLARNRKKVRRTKQRPPRSVHSRADEQGEKTRGENSEGASINDDHSILLGAQKDKVGVNRPVNPDSQG